MGRLEGKSVVITGAGSGIGRAASVLFSKEGAKLIIVDKTDGVKETARLVSDAGVGVTHLGEAFHHRAHRELFRPGGTDLVPRERRRDPGVR